MHIEDISRAFLALMEAPRDARARRGVQRGIDRGELPHPRRRRDRGRASSPASTVTLSDEAFNDLRNYRVNCDKLAERVGYSTKWTVRRRRARAARGLPGPRAHPRRPGGRPLHAHQAGARSTSTSGRLDADLRWTEVTLTRATAGLWRRRRAAVPRPGQDAAVRRAGDSRRASTAPSPASPSRWRSAPTCTIVPDPRGRRPGDAVPRGLPVLLVVLRPPARPLARPRAGPHRHPGPRAGVPRGRAGLQRRLPPAQLRRGRRARARHRPGAGPGRGGQRQRRARRICEFFGAELAHRLRGRGHGRRPT